MEKIKLCKICEEKNKKGITIIVSHKVNRDNRTIKYIYEICIDCLNKDSTIEVSTIA